MPNFLLLIAATYTTMLKDAMVKLAHQHDECLRGRHRIDSPKWRVLLKPRPYSGKLDGVIRDWCGPSKNDE